MEGIAADQFVLTEAVIVESLHFVGDLFAAERLVDASDDDWALRSVMISVRLRLVKLKSAHLAAIDDQEYEPDKRIYEHQDEKWDRRWFILEHADDSKTVESWEACGL